MLFCLRHSTAFLHREVRLEAKVIHVTKNLADHIFTEKNKECYVVSTPIPFFLSVPLFPILCSLARSLLCVMVLHNFYCTQLL